MEGGLHRTRSHARSPPGRSQYDESLLARNRAEHVLYIAQAVNTFYTSLHECLRFTAAQPLRMGRERLFVLVAAVAANRADEERQVCTQLGPVNADARMTHGSNVNSSKPWKRIAC